MEKKQGNPTSMVAPKSREQASPALYLVEDLATERNLAGWFVAGLRQATGWAAGKMVTRDEFDAAATRFAARPQGSGKI
jgi:hypothetical protein